MGAFKARRYDIFEWEIEDNRRDLGLSHDLIPPPAKRNPQKAPNSSLFLLHIANNLSAPDLQIISCSNFFLHKLCVINSEVIDDPAAFLLVLCHRQDGTAESKLGAPTSTPFALEKVAVGTR